MPAPPNQRGRRPRPRVTDLRNQRAAYAWATAVLVGAYLALPKADRDHLPAGLHTAYDNAAAMVDTEPLPRGGLVAGALMTLPEAQTAALVAWEADHAEVWDERQLATSAWPGWAEVLGEVWEQTDEGAAMA